MATAIKEVFQVFLDESVARTFMSNFEIRDLPSVLSLASRASPQISETLFLIALSQTYKPLKCPMEACQAIARIPASFRQIRTDCARFSPPRGISFQYWLDTLANRLYENSSGDRTSPISINKGWQRHAIRTGWIIASRFSFESIEDYLLRKWLANGLHIAIDPAVSIHYNIPRKLHLMPYQSVDEEKMILFTLRLTQSTIHQAWDNYMIHIRTDDRALAQQIVDALNVRITFLFSQKISSYVASQIRVWISPKKDIRLCPVVTYANCSAPYMGPQFETQVDFVPWTFFAKEGPIFSLRHYKL